MRVNLKCVFKTFAAIAILATLAMPAFAAGEHEFVTGGVVFPLGGDSLWMGSSVSFRLRCG